MITPGSCLPCLRVVTRPFATPTAGLSKALADRSRLGQGPLTCQEMAAAFAMDVVPSRVEALRSKAKRLVARGWLAEPAPGRFTLAAGVAGPDGGS
jgi:hypothetical protein